jgi:acyl-CoA thioesterase-1
MAKVVIIGDSISDGYTPLVRGLLSDSEIIVEQYYAGDSAQLLAGLPQWVAGSPDLIQFNCGLHDARYYPTSRIYQQTSADYESNLRQIVAWLRTHRRARLLWASTTPVITERITIEYVRYPADIIANNAVASQIMAAAHIPINDLYAVIGAHSIADCISDDGVHMTERGNVLLAQAVARAVLDLLTQKA